MMHRWPRVAGASRGSAKRCTETDNRNSLPCCGGGLSRGVITAMSSLHYPSPQPSPARGERVPAVALRPGRDADADGFVALIGACWDQYPGIVLDVDAEMPELRALASHYANKGGAW